MRGIRLAPARLAALLVVAGVVGVACEPQPVKTTGSLTSTGSMLVAREGQSATLLKDGRVLVAGGDGDDPTGRDPFVVNSSAELYDPAAGTFSITGSMTTPRSGHTATLLNDGRVLITGGRSGVAEQDLDSAELYDPATGTFSPTGRMARPRSGQAATLLLDGRVLITGGNPQDASASPWFAVAELFDPRTRSFTSAGPMPTHRTENAATRLQDGRVLTVAGYPGGGTGTDLAALYDPDSGTVTPVNLDTESGSSLNVLTLHDGRVLIDDGGSDVELYDPAAGTFSTSGSKTNEAVGGPAVLLSDGKVLIGNGSCVAEYCNYPQLFDPHSNGFSAAPVMPSHTKFSTMTLLPDGRVLLTGGGRGSDASQAHLFQE
jgi:hypothetical protein